MNPIDRIFGRKHIWPPMDKPGFYRCGACEESHLHSKYDRTDPPKRGCWA